MSRFVATEGKARGAEHDAASILKSTAVMLPIGVLRAPRRAMDQRYWSVVTHQVRLSQPGVASVVPQFSVPLTVAL